MEPNSTERAGIELPALEPLEDGRVYELIGRAQQNDKEARRELVEHNLKLVMSIVGRFTGRAEADDLFQIGCIGLVKAIDRFDLSQGVRFSTYAVPVIIGEIRQFLRQDGPIKVGRSLKENAMRVRSASSQLAQELGREPTVVEIAERLNVSGAEVAAALEAMQPVQSLNEPAHEGEGDATALEDRISAQEEEYPWLEQYALHEALNLLDERLRLILKLRYVDEQTQAQVAEVVGVSQVQVSRLERQALLKLRGILRE